MKGEESPPDAGSANAHKPKMLARIQFMTLCWSLFLCGWNDGTTGPSLPRLQEVYLVNYTIVSLIFVFGFVGYLAGALVNMYLTNKLGFGKTIVFGSLCQAAAYCTGIQASAPPFPLFVMAYIMNAVGMSVQAAQAVGFVATLKDQPEAKMGILNAAYGFGSFSAPLVATQFAQHPRWSFHFPVSLGIAILNTGILIAVFKFQEQDDCLKQAGEDVDEKPIESTENTFHQVMRTRVVHHLSFFLFLYLGVEVTIGGWIVSFIIDSRGGGPASGYISSAFFAGLTIGPVALLWVNKKVGERLVLFLYAIGALALEFVIWFVPSLVGNAVAVLIVGILLGPMYTIVVNHASHTVPRRILTGSIGWISGFGQAGSALFPFITGVFASKYGIQSLPPLLVGMTICMIFLWALVPSPRTSV